MSTGNQWVLLRAAAILFSAFSVFSSDPSGHAFDLESVAVIGVVVPIVVFLWFQANFRRMNIQVDHPFAIDYPFWPMNRHPIRFFTTLSYGFVIGGTVRLLMGPGWTPALFIFLGLGIQLAAFLFVKSRSAAP